jgi:hypothetical protein
VRNSTKTDTFCYDGDFTKLEVSEPLEKLFRWLDVHEHYFRWSFNGYYTWQCPMSNCEVDRVYLPMIDHGSLHPYASFKHVNRCEGRIIEQLEFLEQNSPLDYLSHVVLTVPGWVSDGLLDHDTLPRFRGAVHYFLGLLSKRLFRHHPHSQLGAWFAVHPWSSPMPLHKHLHAHLLLPNVSYNKKERRFYRFQPWIDERLVKECWREALIRVGLWDAADPNLPDVMLQYYRTRVLPRRLFKELSDRAGVGATDPSEAALNLERLLDGVPSSSYTMLNPRVKHKIRYAFRLPLVDLNENLESWMLAGADRRWAEFLVNYTTRRLKAGFLTNLKRFGFLCRKSILARCPVCGSEMAKLGAVYSNLPDVPHFIRTRDGEWAKIPPPFDVIPGQTDELVPRPQPARLFDFYEARVKFALATLRGDRDA